MKMSDQQVVALATNTPTIESNQNRNRNNQLIRSDKWDYVLSNLLFSTSIGFGFGLLTSLIFLRRRLFPVWLGIGFGFGKGYAEGDLVFRTNTGIRSVIV